MALNFLSSASNRRWRRMDGSWRISFVRRRTSARCSSAYAPSTRLLTCARAERMWWAAADAAVAMEEVVVEVVVVGGGARGVAVHMVYSAAHAAAAVMHNVAVQPMGQLGHGEQMERGGTGAERARSGERDGGRLANNNTNHTQKGERKGNEPSESTTATTNNQQAATHFQHHTYIHRTTWGAVHTPTRGHTTHRSPHAQPTSSTSPHGASRHQHHQPPHHTIPHHAGTQH